MIERRSLYFAFQGLLSAVLLLMFLLQPRGYDGWVLRFTLLLAMLAMPLLVLQFVSKATLGRWWFQMGFFLLDAAAATMTLFWREPLADAYLVYFLIIFGTAMTRSFTQSIVVGVVVCGLYLLVAWHPSRGLPIDTEFWLRFQLLIITTTLLSLSSRDAANAQSEQERRYQQRLIQVEKLATLGRVAGEVAHRIKGPLTTIRVNAEVLTYKFAKSKEALKQLSEIEEEVEHCKQILKNLLDLGRIEEMDFAPLDLRDPVREALRSVETQRKRKGLAVHLRGLEAALPVRGDQSLLQEAVAALLQNAIEAGKEGGRITLSVERGAQGKAVRVLIEDDGKGIAEADLERVFQPFFTTKSEGTGLGLSAALRIFQKHDGTLEAHSEGEGLGARFTLTLPLA